METQSQELGLVLRDASQPLLLIIFVLVEWYGGRHGERLRTSIGLFLDDH